MPDSGIRRYSQPNTTGHLICQPVVPDLLAHFRTTYGEGLIKLSWRTSGTLTRGEYLTIKRILTGLPTAHQSNKDFLAVGSERVPSALMNIPRPIDKTHLIFPIKHMHHLCRLLFIIVTCTPLASLAQQSDTINAVNTQAAGEHPPAPEQSASRISVPTGFSVSLFAGEPSVHQPIAFDFDDQGRLWVVECYTYEGNYDLTLHDRILILEDSDGDGSFDKRKVFWDEGQRLTGITLGFGGVWLTSAPNLLFIPDRDQNDVPDGEPEIALEGFSTRARHNMVNGLRWGPDGWLYGRHGITDTSLVGTPVTPSGKRIKLNCSIWRYHPSRKEFQVVTHGTTNPWGLDYNDHGQWFFTNNVINHLWHVVPGAHYERMFGDDFNPNLYELIQPTADHFHWDTLGDPGLTNNANRKKYDGRHDPHGGGHSHAGGMIYLGGKWPLEFRNAMFMCNTHGRRVNMDNLIRDGSSYRATHGKDFLIANDPWFRGVELKYGPDGDVYLTDWSDLGECHDRDGVHRSSGRIYKIIYSRDSTPNTLATTHPDLHSASPLQLAQLQLHENDWYVRHARRRLQEQALAGADLEAATNELLKIYKTNNQPTRKLRALWCLHSINAASEKWLTQQLNHPNEHIRLWAVQLLVDSPSRSKNVGNVLSTLARIEPSPLVRLFLASAMQKLPQAERWELANSLANHSEDLNDRVQPLMVWYGIEPAVLGAPTKALELARTTVNPTIRRHISRRLASEIDTAPSYITKLLQSARESSPASALDYLEGIAAALRGRKKLDALPTWLTLIKHFQNTPLPKLRDIANELLVVFGDGRTIDSLLDIARQQDADPAARRQALKVILDSGPKGIQKALLSLRSDRIIGAAAIRGLAQYPSANIPAQLIKMYPNAKHDHRPAIIETLASRPSYAVHLLEALSKGNITPDDIPAGTASRIANLGDPKINALLDQHWGSVRASSKEKELNIKRYRDMLRPTQQPTQNNITAADKINGRKLFNKSCATCHMMFSEGKKIGPDLTGSNRDSIDYLLDNIIDPSRIVPRGMRQSIFLLKDGQVITGVPIRENANIVTVQTTDSVTSIDISAIQRRQQQETSLMPEGLLENLSDKEVQDLFAFLQSPTQVGGAN